VSSFLRFCYLLVTWWWPGDEPETCCHLVILNKISIHNTGCVLTCESLLLICMLRLADPSGWGHNISPIHLVAVNAWRSLLSQKKEILNYIAQITSNVISLPPLASLSLILQQFPRPVYFSSLPDGISIYFPCFLPYSCCTPFCFILPTVIRLPFLHLSHIN